jgi:lipopolysaccharide biosynthesis regulator YciM
MYDLASRQLDEALEAASRSGEREVEIRYMLGSVYEAMGDHSRALEAYSRVYEKDIHYRDVAAKMNTLSPNGEGPQNEDQERSR